MVGCICVCTYTVPLEGYDRVSLARARVTYVPAQIVRELEKEDIVTTRCTVIYASDLLLDEGRWIGRPEQVGAAFCVTKKMAEFMDKRLEEDEELSARQLH